MTQKPWKQAWNVIGIPAFQCSRKIFALFVWPCAAAVSQNICLRYMTCPAKVFQLKNKLRFNTLHSQSQILEDLVATVEFHLKKAVDTGHGQLTAQKLRINTFCFAWVLVDFQALFIRWFHYSACQFSTVDWLKMTIEKRQNFPVKIYVRFIVKHEEYLPNNANSRQGNQCKTDLIELTLASTLYEVYTKGYLRMLEFVEIAFDDRQFPLPTVCIIRKFSFYQAGSHWESMLLSY